MAVPRPVRHLEEAEFLCHLGRGHRCPVRSERGGQAGTTAEVEGWSAVVILLRAPYQAFFRSRPVPAKGAHGLTIGHILLVGKHQEEAVAHLSVVQDLVQLFARLVDPGAVLRVDDKDETLRAGVVVPPEGSDLVLAADVLRAREFLLSYAGRRAGGRAWARA